MKFSIIMPTYNCEKYVVEAVNSVLEQTYADFELIIVDDGSHDGTFAVCERLAKDKDNVHLFAAEHGGVSRARNFGLKKSQGDYVLFIDSDDSWEKDLLAKISEVLSLEDELLIFGYRSDYYLSDGTFQYSNNSFGNEGEIVELPNDYSVDSVFSSYNMAAPWNKVFRNDVIKRNNLFFNDKCVYLEDLKFNFDYLKLVTNIKVLKHDLYHYRLFTDKRQILKRNFGEAFVNADELYHSAITYLSKKNVDLRSSKTITGLLLTAYFKELLCQINQKSKKEIKYIYRAFKKNKNLIILLKASKGKLSKLLLIMKNSFLMLQLSLIKRRYE